MPIFCLKLRPTKEAMDCFLLGLPLLSLLLPLLLKLSLELFSVTLMLELRYPSLGNLTFHLLGFFGPSPSTRILSSASSSLIYSTVLLLRLFLTLFLCLRNSPYISTLKVFLRRLGDFDTLQPNGECFICCC
jgi:hypothetical protein